MRDAIADRRAADVTASSRVTRRALAVLLFAVLTAMGAAIEVPMPGTLVPMTLQTLVVSLSGVLLGPMLGAMSQSAYLLAGALGAPVFSGGDAGFGQLFGVTGGYLLAFPIAAAVTGRLAGPVPARWTVPAAMRLWCAILIGTAVIFGGGAVQLALLTGSSAAAIRQGVLPFIIGDLLKVTVALLVALRYRARTLEWL